ncbi:hypothetical protein ACLS0R_10370 [Comamonas jiangduensis]|uniref:hypothetical protein n=1 Tax=Comamonas jiangduensis TaxID=1194168 RepID=UPI003BF89BCB
MNIVLDAVLAVTNKALNKELKGRGHKFYKSASLTQSFFLLVDCLNREGRVTRSISLVHNVREALLVCRNHRPLRSRITLGQRIESKNGHWEFSHVRKIWGEPNGTPHFLETNLRSETIAVKEDTASVKTLILLFEDDDKTLGDAKTNWHPSFI